MNKRRFAVAGAILSALFVNGGAVHAQLAARVEVTHSPGTWSYTLFNDEPVGSTNYFSGFGLFVAARITVTGTPSGWGVDTDNATYVSWFNLDAMLPYPNDVAPGASLSGFQIQSTVNESGMINFELAAWDHNTDASGPIVTGTVLGPQVTNTADIPEPGTLSFLFLGAMAALMSVLPRRRASHSKGGA